jgi:hypothetical protein
MTFESSERERRLDAVSLSQKCGAGKFSYASPATIAAELRGLPRDDRDKYLSHFDRRCVDWMDELVNGRTT